MSAVITNIGDLEFVWRAASDGFSAGVDFKVWLANTVIQLRADLQAAQERIAEFESGDLVAALLEANRTQADRIMQLEMAVNTFLNRLDTLP